MKVAASQCWREALLEQRTCRICGKDGIGQPFDDWVKPTFTDWDKLQPGEIICNDCLFWFDERSELLAQKVDKDKPQRMRNYSHFIVGGEWIPLSKGDKARMKELLLREPFPELAAIAESGQKHIVFRATRNPPGAKAGWVQFEEQSLFLEPEKLAVLLSEIEELYTTFSKAEIESGDYASYRILKFGFDEWMALEAEIKSLRGGLLFALAIFLAQKGDENAPESSRFAHGDLAGDTAGLQEQVPKNDLAAVRGQREVGGLHEQPGQVRQLTLL